jgi:Sec-independent protein translocase protein TatA
MSSVGPVELFIVIVIAIVVAVLVLREIGKRGR